MTENGHYGLKWLVGRERERASHMVVNAKGSECTALGDLSERDFSLWESKRHVTISLLRT